MIYLILYIISIIGANVMILTIGFLPVGFGYTAPAGVYLVGLTFSLRDIVQERLGKWYSIGAIGIGAAISAIFSPTLAIASATAFLISELLDLSVYTWLRAHSITLALVLSNIIGIIIDTFVFLPLAGIPLEFATGQIIGKLYGTVAAVFILLLYKKYSAPVTL